MPNKNGKKKQTKIKDPMKGMARKGKPDFRNEVDNGEKTVMAKNGKKN